MMIEWFKKFLGLKWISWIITLITHVVLLCFGQLNPESYASIVITVTLGLLAGRVAEKAISIKREDKQN